MLSRNADPIVAIATAPGRGAVGIVRVSGRALGPFIDALCGRPLKAREATYLAFRDAAGEPIDHGLAIHFPAPHSFTGEDVLELQAHGGPVVLQLLVARCLAAAEESIGAANGPAGVASDGPAAGPASRAARRLGGLRVAEPGEFSQRAFLNGKIDLAQAEAIADLIDASTEAAARSASRSLSGAFSHDIHALRDALVHLRMLVEATLDFPEEDIDFLQKADAAGQLAALRERLAAVRQRTRQGALLREGIRVVIAGQPNAGKSSLLNALAGAELAIVSAVAGTTRDVVSQTIQIQGVPLHVADTAGLREGADEIERIGVERAWRQIGDADAVLFLHDLTRIAEPGHRDADAAILARLPAGVPVLHAWNKHDAAPEAATPATSAQGIAISAKTGHGIEALRQRLLDIAGWQAMPEGLYLARERHVHALGRVAAHLDIAFEVLAGRVPALDLLAEELRLAQNALNEITGEFGADDLLGVIFSRFCIGK
jgi:tRNA modification GTPase